MTNCHLMADSCPPPLRTDLALIRALCLVPCTFMYQAIAAESSLLEFYSHGRLGGQGGSEAHDERDLMGAPQEDV